MKSILKYGKPLLGSAGKEYDYQFVGMDPAERLAHQKKSLTARLGLGGEYIEEELVTSKDIETPKYPLPNQPSKLQTNLPRRGSMASPITPSEATAQTPGGEALSARQLNALKRKNKRDLKEKASKVRVVDFSERRPSIVQTPSAAQPYPIKTEVKEEESENGVSDYFSLDRRNGADDDTKLVTEFKGEPVPEKSAFMTEDEEAGNEWPFDRLMEFLTVDLFDHAWETRHGAAMAIREVIRVHGAGAGRCRGKSKSQNDLLNQRWLEDLACRLCCVFMLDRFGDYSAEGVVVPVRETAGQALGAVLQYLPGPSVKAVFDILQRLCTQNKEQSWQPMHGGILGMKYLVAVRNDLLLQDASLLDEVLECVMNCLSDDDDDVRAGSAATLIPIAKEIVMMRAARIDRLLLIVWDCLSNLSDDLSVSTGSVMDLLAKLCSFSDVLTAMKTAADKDPDRSFSRLVPRLYPFLRHTLPGVRSAVLRALLTFINIEGEASKGWVDGKILRLIFQNLLVERVADVLLLSKQVWNGLITTLVEQGDDILADELAPHIGPLFTLATGPMSVEHQHFPMEASLFMKPSGQSYGAPDQRHSRKISPIGEPPKKRQRKSNQKETPSLTADSPHDVDNLMLRGDLTVVGFDVMMRCRIAAAEALGQAAACWPKPEREKMFSSEILNALQSQQSSTKLIAALICEEYGKRLNSPESLTQILAPALQTLVDEPPLSFYTDLVSYSKIVHTKCHHLLSVFRDSARVLQSRLPTIPALVQGDENANKFAFSMADAEKMVGEDYERLMKSLSPTNRVASSEALLISRTEAESAIAEANKVKTLQDVRIKAVAASAIVALNSVPKKMSQTMKALMDSIKQEKNLDLQKRSAAGVSAFVDNLAATGRPTPIEKCVANLVKFYCSDTAETPVFGSYADVKDGIISLNKEEDVQEHQVEDILAARIQRRGAKEALEQLCMRFAAQLFDKVPILKFLIHNPIQKAFTSDNLADLMAADAGLGQEIVDGMSTLRALVAKFDTALHPFILELLPLIAKTLKCDRAVLRYAAAKCFASICRTMTVEGMTVLVDSVIPAIGNAVDVHWRQGAIECLYHLIHTMEDGILPYVIFLIVPVLGRMSDADNDVRLLATTSFATLIKLVPLEAGIPDPPGLPKEMIEGRDRERQFMAQMLDPKKVENFEIPVAIKATLRHYQQEGVNWLAFLNRYNLHGVLCDDMGLGKTLQTLCIVASDHHMRAERFEKTQNPEVRRLPSLIVCPPSVSGHWEQEIRTFAPFLSALAYVGPANERAKIRSKLTKVDIVITSYNVCLTDNDVLAPLNWNYCVLDEGHQIKNPKTKTTQTVKKMKSNHRLILTGTPIQNNVVELWSLFDFLMPGFLGAEKVFQERFAKPIQASRNAKANTKEQAAGAAAIEALHKQVLPFLLRRMKEQVLDDLPPKIIQNYYCDLSEVQRDLFEAFTKKQSQKLAADAVSNSKEGKQHIFQALQYLRKLCNSPALAITPKHSQYEAVKLALAKKGTSLDDPIHAPKLGALRDLLLDCGIGAADTALDNPAEGEFVSQHRALIFCQMKEMMDMVQNSVFKKLLPSVQYLRLDGSVEASKRQDIVNRFNSDPSYDCLLLSTSVGGLGLNLTGADTVIFMEHDWNPQKDLQAMDRAHRIGQKKVVNVYRIVTRGTLEEKILRYVRYLRSLRMRIRVTDVIVVFSGSRSMSRLRWLTSRMLASGPWRRINFSIYSISRPRLRVTLRRCRRARM